MSLLGIRCFQSTRQIMLNAYLGRHLVVQHCWEDEVFLSVLLFVETIIKIQVMSYEFIVIIPKSRELLS